MAVSKQMSCKSNSPDLGLRYEVIFSSAAGTHFRLLGSKKEAIHLARMIRRRGHEPRIVDWRERKIVYGDHRFELAA
jgi:hypothetical protein